MSMSAAESFDAGTYTKSDPGLTTRSDDRAFEAIGQTVRHAAGAIDDLKDILEQLEASIAKTTDDRQTEEQIGRLFIKAREFVDRAVRDAQETSRNLVAEAEFEASRIVSAAKDETSRLVDGGPPSSTMPREALRQLQATIDGFDHVNRALLDGLSALNQMLAAHPPPGPVERMSPTHSHGTEISTDATARDHPAPAPVEPSSPSSGYWDRRLSPARRRPLS
jgi:hypothetical protein